MGLRIQNNIAAMNAHRNLQIADEGMSKSLARLSSGFRINNASDDAAGLAVSSGMRADIASYKVASRNTSEAIALLQVAEGAYDQIGNILTRLKELTTQGTSANASGNSSDISNEVTALKAELDRIANATEYNGQAVVRGYGTSVQAYSAGIDEASERATVGLTSVSTSGVTDNVTYTITATTAGVTTITNGTTGQAESQTSLVSGAKTMSFQALGITLNLGANYVATNAALNAQTLVFTVAGGNFITGIKNDANNRINVGIDKVSAADLSIDTVTGIVAADLTLINTAIDTLASSRAEIGAAMNRLSYAAANLASSIENTQAAESVIRDVDMAAEMTGFTKNQILLQAGTAMLAQANMAPQGILSLFK
jgi:flagellin